MKLRFVLGPDGQVYFDLSGKAPGESVELSARRDEFNKALSQLDQLGRVPEDLVQQVEKMLLKRFEQSLNMAKKAGVVSLGFDKAKQAIEKGKARLIILAEDAGKDIKGRVNSMKKGGYALFSWGSNAQLASIFGVAACSVVCLKEGPSTKQVADLLKKIQAFSLKEDKEA